MEFSELTTDKLKDLTEEFEKLRSIVQLGDFDNELGMSVFKKEIDVTLMQCVESLYNLAMKHHLSMALCNFYKFKEVTTIRDYYDNLLLLQSAVKMMVDKKGKELAMHVSSSLDVESNYAKEWFKNCQQFAGFLEDMSSFFGTATCVSEKNGTANNKNYYKVLSRNIWSMNNALNRASTKIDCFSRGDQNDIETFKFIHAYYNESAKLITSMIDQIMTKFAVDKKLKETRLEDTSTNRPKVVLSKQDEINDERLMTIREANMMYDELVSGTMRDLERQVPYSVREMYEHFVNVKFANFVKNFSMPLSESTKLSVAKEVCRQLNELNNYVSKISENATSTNIYMMKE